MRAVVPRWLFPAHATLILVLGFSATFLVSCGEGGAASSTGAAEAGSAEGAEPFGAGAVELSPLEKGARRTAGPASPSEAASSGDSGASEEPVTPVDLSPEPDELSALEQDVESIIADAIAAASGASGGKATESNCAVAVMAVDVGSGEVMVRRLGDLPLVPASNLKLMTVAAGLAGLGPVGAFRSVFVAHGDIAGGTLDGDLVVRAGGDPLYRADGNGGLDPWLDDLRSSLTKAGIERVTGALVLDEGTWLDPGPGPQWPAPSDHWQMYCALSAGFTVNAGSFRATVTPQSDRGAVDVVLRPRHHGLKRRGSVKLGKRNAVNVGANSGGVTVKGTIPASSRPLVTEFSAPDPVDLFGHAFVGGLRDRGVSIEGGFVRRRDVTESGALVHTITTPILDVFRPILEDSHNSLADQLFFALGAQTENAGTRAGGAAAVASALEKLGVPTDGLEQVDGSGLSKANRTSAMQLVGLVAALVKTGGRTAEVFLDALPVAGKTGSLSKRMRGTPAEGRVRAKTGWVQGASALSGVAETVDGRSVVFSILVGYPRLSGLNTKAWKPMQDRLCEALVLWRRGASR
ncbi:MAG: D-alanyl-D-alanine carboxypeptidase/D-alanyl-D-alanine-endopeptidase [Planctomycetota bacterium]